MLGSIALLLFYILTIHKLLEISHYLFHDIAHASEVEDNNVSPLVRSKQHHQVPSVTFYPT